MKKLLSILATVGLVATTGATVVACGPKDPATVKGDFTIKLDQSIHIGTQSTITIDKYKDLSETLEEFKLVIPTEGNGKDVIKQVGEFDDTKGQFTIEGLKEGSVDVQIEATVKVQSQAEEPAKQISNVLTIKVDLVSLVDVKLDAIDNEVIDNTNVTDEEAKAAQELVKTKVQEAIVAKIAGVKLNIDYTINLKDIKAGDLSKGINVSVDAKEGSKLIKALTKTTVKVTFTIPAPVEKKSIKDVEVEAQAGVATNGSVKAAVLQAINWSVDENVTADDFTIDGLGDDDEFIAEDAIITVTASEESTLIEDSFTVKVTPAPILKKSIKDVEVEAQAGVATNGSVRADVLEAIKSSVDENVTADDFTIDGLGGDDEFIAEDAIITVTASEESTLIEDSFTVKVTPAPIEKNITDIIEDNHDLGNIVRGAVPTEDTVKNAIEKEFGEQLGEAKVIVSDLKNEDNKGSATISIEGYEGTVTVTYTYGRIS